MTKTELRILIGLPASGKSTYSKEVSEQNNSVIHSSDELRLELYGSYNEFDKNGELFAELHRRTKRDLENGKNVVLDATNLSRKKRVHVVSQMPKNTNVIAVVFATPVDVCIERDTLRERKVGAHIIRRMLKNFQFPLYGEGFNEIEIIEINSIDKRKNYEDMMKIADDFEQNNPHHTLTVGKHMTKATTEYINSKFPSNIDLNIATSLMLHDSGKLYTASFKNKNGEITDICHYYGHENVSSYNSLLMNFVALTKDELIYQAQLIQYHMLANTALKTVKSERKWLDLLGEKMYNDIVEFNKWDKKGK